MKHCLLTSKYGYHGLEKSTSYHIKINIHSVLPTNNKQGLEA